MMRNIANEKQAIERYDEDEECSILFTYNCFMQRELINNPTNK